MSKSYKLSVNQGTTIDLSESDLINLDAILPLIMLMVLNILDFHLRKSINTLYIICR